jgi:hypothetical protein
MSWLPPLIELQSAMDGAASAADRASTGHGWRGFRSRLSFNRPWMPWLPPLIELQPAVDVMASATD